MPSQPPPPKPEPTPNARATSNGDTDTRAGIELFVQELSGRLANKAPKLAGGQSAEAVLLFTHDDGDPPTRIVLHMSRTGVKVAPGAATSPSVVFRAPARAWLAHIVDPEAPMDAFDMFGDTAVLGEVARLAGIARSPLAARFF